MVTSGFAVQSDTMFAFVAQKARAQVNNTG
jgi:hypothetical protein